MRKLFQNSPGAIDSTFCVPVGQPTPYKGDEAEPSHREGWQTSQMRVGHGLCLTEKVVTLVCHPEKARGALMDLSSQVPSTISYNDTI